MSDAMLPFQPEELTSSSQLDFSFLSTHVQLSQRTVHRRTLIPRPQRFRQKVFHTAVRNVPSRRNEIPVFILGHQSTHAATKSLYQSEAEPTWFVTPVISFLHSRALYSASARVPMPPCVSPVPWIKRHQNLSLPGTSLQTQYHLGTTA